MNNSKLKESNIKWLGKIPDNWKTIKFNALYDLRNEKVSDKDFPPLSVTKMGIVPQLSNAAKTNNGDNRKLVEIGDFAINSRSDRRGSCGISKYEGSVSLINTVLKPINREMNPRYYGWLFKTVEFADEFYKWGHGIVDDLWTTNWQDMKNITLVCPSKTEQNKIADFLDKKVSQIDDISKKIQQEITDLEAYRKSVITKTITKGLNPNVPMKDSGIEWIGKIPTDWSVIRLKYLGSAGNGLTYSPQNMTDESGTLILRSSNIQHGEIVNADNVYVNSSVSKSLILKKDDLLICSRNGSKDLIGKNALINKEFIGSSFGAFMCVFRSKYNQYIYYVLNSNIFKFYVGSFLTSTINQLTKHNLYNLAFPFPQKENERKQIIAFLKEKCENINHLITHKKDQLKLLNQYKQSIIYEYVTGKKPVPTEEGVQE
ncbi:restriction endonuclease subunit S [Lactobacillus amylovorus]|uniref:restriction endonuclease subunit S n=1 Tax=Lactobacillus amylovorus TaxID=1604 RepID=UPI00232E7177|nr:restriction endonuclease subunit S [Lactobacillus amylovorus]MDB6238113.1 restriction endonuclease subunit S [Lactobacillus amylovorus]